MNLPKTNVGKILRPTVEGGGDGEKAIKCNHNFMPPRGRAQKILCLPKNRRIQRIPNPPAVPQTLTPAGWATCCSSPASVLTPSRDPETDGVPPALLRRQSPTGNYTEFDFEAQCHSVFQMCGGCWKPAALKMENLVDVTVFLTDMHAIFTPTTASTRVLPGQPAPAGRR